MSSTRTSTITLFLIAVFSAHAILTTSGGAFAQVPLRSYDTTLKNMFDAIQSKSYDKFMVDADERFKSGFTPKMFEELARQLGPKLEKGYSVAFLTTLYQQEYIVYVWKLTFKDVKDDLLVTLFIKDGNVSGLVTR